MRKPVHPAPVPAPPAARGPAVAASRPPSHHRTEEHQP